MIGWLECVDSVAHVTTVNGQFQLNRDCYFQTSDVFDASEGSLLIIQKDLKEDIAV